MGRELSNAEIQQRIFFVRGHRVMLDSDLAELYEVKTRALNQGVRRNESNFPEDFMFRVTEQEYESLRSQIGTSKKGRGAHRKYLPLVFTEQGVAMLSSVLKSAKAVQVNIAIIRTFVKLREMIGTNKELARQIDQLERKLSDHDNNFKEVFNAIRHLMSVGAPPAQKRIKGLSRD